MARRSKSSKLGFAKYYTSWESWFRLLYIVAVPLIIFFFRKDVLWQPWLYPDYGQPIPKGEVLYGLDISHWQGTIDWSLVGTGKEPMHFAFMKATQGTAFKDSKFKSNWKLAGKSGIRRGAYHFFEPSADAEKQAKHFLKQVKLQAGDLPPVLDVEENYLDKSDRSSDSALKAGVKTWLEIVEKETGRKPIIYCNLGYYDRFFKTGFEDYPLWIARYRRISLGNVKRDSRVKFWQFTDRATINGIEGGTDMNVFFGDSLELAAFVGE